MDIYPLITRKSLFIPNLSINFFPAGIVGCSPNLNDVAASSDKRTHQYRRHDFIIAADIVDLRDLCELFSVAFQIHWFIKRRQVMILRPRQMVEISGNGYDFFDI